MKFSLRKGLSVVSYNTIKLFIFFLPQATFSQDLMPCQFPGDIIINHEAYTVDYSMEHKQARWNYYTLVKTRIYGKVKRKSSFCRDPELTMAESCRDNDYQGSRCDKGHLAPAEDMSFSRVAMRESFFLSNVAPQIPGFNRGIWKRLEVQVRAWKNKADTLHVVTGGYIHRGLPKLKGSVSIPNNFYKIVLAKDVSGNFKAIAFLLPNKPSKDPLAKYLITIDELESLTKVDFCFKLRDDVEDALESSKADLTFWKMN